jgi:hypothetical protein
MPEMKAADQKAVQKEAGGKPKYFRGDEPPTSAVRASLTPAP